MTSGDSLQDKICDSIASLEQADENFIIGNKIDRIDDNNRYYEVDFLKPIPNYYSYFQLTPSLMKKAVLKISKDGEMTLLNTNFKKSYDSLGKFEFRNNEIIFKITDEKPSPTKYLAAAGLFSFALYSEYSHSSLSSLGSEVISTLRSKI